MILKILQIVSILVNHTDYLITLGIEEKEYNKLNTLYNKITSLTKTIH